MRNKNLLFFLLFICALQVGCGAGSLGAGAVYNEIDSDSTNENEINFSGSFSLLDLILPKAYAESDHGFSVDATTLLSNGKACIFSARYLKNSGEVVWEMRKCALLDDDGNFDLGVDGSKLSRANCAIFKLCAKDSAGTKSRCTLLTGAKGLAASLDLNADNALTQADIEAVMTKAKNAMENSGKGVFCRAKSKEEMDAFLASEHLSKKAAKAAADAAAKAAADAAAKAAAAAKAKGGMKLGGAAKAGGKLGGGAVKAP